MMRVASHRGARFAFFGWAGFLTENVVLSHNRQTIIEHVSGSLFFSLALSRRKTTFNVSSRGHRSETISITCCTTRFLLLHVCQLRTDCTDIDLNINCCSGILRLLVEQRHLHVYR
jgi:hypothetical protein